LLTLLADSLKAVMPMILVNWILHDHADGNFWVVIAGGAAFLGHLYPIYLKFKGGKGVATALGVFLYLAPVSVLIAAATFGLVVSGSGYVSLGSLSAAALLPVILWGMGEPRAYIWLAVLVGALIWIKHGENIGRLLRHEENSMKNKKRFPNDAAKQS
jgi:glycerol-3-phosphate acyltransferase PlsY